VTDDGDPDLPSESDETGTGRRSLEKIDGFFVGWFHTLNEAKLVPLAIPIAIVAPGPFVILIGRIFAIEFLEAVGIAAITAGIVLLVLVGYIMALSGAWHGRKRK